MLLFPAEYPFKPPGIKVSTLPIVGPCGGSLTHVDVHSVGALFARREDLLFHVRLSPRISEFSAASRRKATNQAQWNPAWSVATILTGLLSFMLSDEMTTGSVASSEAYKRAFAARSHCWNITQPRFKEAFPEYSSPVMRDLPNMGEKERRKPDAPPQGSSHPPPSLSLSATTPIPAAVQPMPAAAIAPNPEPVAPRKANEPMRAGGPALPAVAWTWTNWQSFIYEKWRLCAVIALVAMLSRFSTRT